MTVNERKGLLLAKGYTLRQLAREYGRSHTLVSSVIRGVSRSRPLEKRVAAIIGRPVHEVFPEYATPSAA